MKFEQWRAEREDLSRLDELDKRWGEMVSREWDAIEARTGKRTWIHDHPDRSSQPKD
jgi:hypothetical protein